MNLAIIGETRHPVLPYGAGGLQRITHDKARALAEFGHTVTLFAPAGSLFDYGELRDGTPNPADFDAVLDYSHAHDLSQAHPDAAIVNALCDRECQYQPPNAVVETRYMQGLYPRAVIVPAGIRLTDMPMPTQARAPYYLAYMGGSVGHKQPEVARQVAQAAGLELVEINSAPTADDERRKWDVLRGALALLCPYTIDASPRTPLEAAALGVPTICLDGDGTREHVEHGVTGYICADLDEQISAVVQCAQLDRYKIRAWVMEHHSFGENARTLETLLRRVAHGARW